MISSLTLLWEEYIFSFSIKGNEFDLNSTKFSLANVYLIAAPATAALQALAAKHLLQHNHYQETTKCSLKCLTTTTSSAGVTSNELWKL